MIDKSPNERRTDYGFACTVNGAAVSLAVPASRTLLHILREELQLTGTKRSCEIGRCGACMVLVDGRPVNACLTMGFQCQGKDVVTIEGLGADDIDPIQQSFLEEGGYQCGYCTPGMIVSVKALLDANPSPSEADIDEALGGNLCRCTGYGGIRRSVAKAIEKRREIDGELA